MYAMRYHTAHARASQCVVLLNHVGTGMLYITALHLTTRRVAYSCTGMPRVTMGSRTFHPNDRLPFNPGRFILVFSGMKRPIKTTMSFKILTGMNRPGRFIPVFSGMKRPM